jgi:hypothetical protein
VVCLHTNDSFVCFGNNDHTSGRTTPNSHVDEKAV